MQKALPAVFASKAFGGVTNRARTGDIQNHNLALYQLSYSHHKVADPIVQPSVRDASSEKSGHGERDTYFYPCLSSRIKFKGFRDSRRCFTLNAKATPLFLTHA